VNALAIPAGGARVDQIRRILDGLANVTAEEFQRSLPNLADFVRVVDALIESDEQWQRRFKREVVIALAKVPASANDDVPVRYSLRPLHKELAEEGPIAVLNVLDKAPGHCPSWTDLVRVYRPDFRVRTDATVEREQDKQYQRAMAYGRDRSPKTLREYRARLARARGLVGRLEHIVKQCEALCLSDWATVPTDILRPPHQRKKAS